MDKKKNMYLAESAEIAEKNKNILLLKTKRFSLPVPPFYQGVALAETEASATANGLCVL
jgi:hypothetical protein